MALDKVASSLHFIKRHGTSRPESSAETYWEPNTDVYVADGGLVIKVELAGMRKEDLKLVIEDNRLTISGHRPDGCRAPKCRFLVMEISYGAFETGIELPPGYDLTLAKAAYQNGFLRIDVPEKVVSVQKPFAVPISSGED
jgi:HSP20 family protein